MCGQPAPLLHTQGSACWEQRRGSSAGGLGSSSGNGMPAAHIMPHGNGAAAAMSVGAKLAQVAMLAEGLSGRALRKLPFQAHAFYVRRPHTTLQQFLEALLLAVQTELQRRTQLEVGTHV
jgi:hypothetical protein